MTTRCLGLTRIPCILMRGGTSRGAYFLSSDLPDDEDIRDQILLKAMGSPHPLQVDGIGGGQTITSKVAIIGPPSVPGADVDYLFAQVSVNEERVDTRANCGNLLAGVGPFAVEAGLVPASQYETAVRVHNVNTGIICEVKFETPGGIVSYSGEEEIDGAPGRSARVSLTFLNAQGAITGALLPTGVVSEEIDGIAVTLVDYAIPVMIADARDFGFTGQEAPEVITASKSVMARIEAMRLEAGIRMGLGDVRKRVAPKVALVSPPEHEGTVTSRYLTPWNCHTAHAVTGGMAIAVSCTLDGSVPARVIGHPAESEGLVRIEHPSGGMGIQLSMSRSSAPLNAPSATIIRTARKLFEGNVLVPDHIWTGTQAVPELARINKNDVLGVAQP